MPVGRKADCPIYEMQVKRVSLEDVFLELTEGEKKSSASKKKSQWKTDRDEHKDEETKSEETEKASRRERGGSVMTAIFKRELKSYLTSMVGYLFIFLSWC